MFEFESLQYGGWAFIIKILMRTSINIILNLGITAITTSIYKQGVTLMDEEIE